MAKCKITSGELVGTEFEISDKTIESLKKSNQKIYANYFLIATKDVDGYVAISLRYPCSSKETLNDGEPYHWFSPDVLKETIKGLQSLFEDEDVRN